MIPKAGYRGQPVLMLVAVLGSWVAARAAMWHPELDDLPPPPGEDADTARKDAAPRKLAALAHAPRQNQADDGSSAPADYAAAIPQGWSASLQPSLGLQTDASLAAAGEPAQPDASTDFAPADLGPTDWAETPPASSPSAEPGFAATRVSFTPVQMPPAGQEFEQQSEAASFAAAPFPPANPAGPAIATRSSRWSGDFWLLLREDTTTAVTSGRGSYGQSQLGAVLRYNLLPSSEYRPAAYVRASQALAGADESEVALGVAARPVPAIPITLAAELRATLVSGQVELRPAAFAYTELAPCDLPLGFTAEAYVQAGYVGGEFETAFADGQLRAEREVAQLGPATLSAGGGTWGGAQEGAERLDLGPGMTLKVNGGAAAARVSLDWRFRVAGDAEPSAGLR